MVHPAGLQQIKGVGAATAKLLEDAGYDSFAKIAAAGEDGLRKIGVNPRAIESIVEQAGKLAPERPQQAEQQETLKTQLSTVREKIENVAESARDRFQERLSGKRGRKLSSDLIRIEDSLERMNGSGNKRRRRAEKALGKAEKRLAGLEDASLKKIRKGLKRVRKVMQKAA